MLTANASKIKTNILPKITFILNFLSENAIFQNSDSLKQGRLRMLK